jgi:hypothetical protein
MLKNTANYCNLPQNIANSFITTYAPIQNHDKLAGTPNQPIKSQNFQKKEVCSVPQ